MSNRTSLFMCLLLLASCHGKGDSTAGSRDLSQFDCKERRAEYMVAGGFAAQEAGISMLCDGKNPRVVRWKADNGERTEDVTPISGGKFDETWERIDATGWRHVDEDCNNPDAQSDDPAYSIGVGDYAVNASLICSGKTLPFPYDRIVNELDLVAAGL